MKTKSILSALIQEIKTDLGLKDTDNRIKLLNSMSLNQLEYVSKQFTSGLKSA